MLTDHLSVGDDNFGLQVFDTLQRGQKLFALYRAGRASLQPDESPPELAAFLEGAVATVYRHALDKVVREIDPDVVRGDSLTLSVSGNTNDTLVTPDLSGTRLALSYAPDWNGSVR